MVAADQSGLSRTGGAEDAEDLAVSELKGDVLNGVDSIAGISKGLADMFQLDHNILLSLLLKIKRAESVAAFRPSEQHNCYTQERFFAEAH